jgi:hypothetical protein
MAKWRAPRRGGYAAGPAKENPKPPPASVTKPAWPDPYTDPWGFLEWSENNWPNVPIPDYWLAVTRALLDLRDLHKRGSTMEVHVPYLDN